MANSFSKYSNHPENKNGEDVIPYVDEAIAIIDESGVKYEVHPLETTMEGEFLNCLKSFKK